MMTVSRKIVAFALLLVVAAWTHPCVSWAGDGWSEDYQKALAQAKKEKKMVLLDFTGSDWCGWCVKLDQEVFSQSEFLSYARENLVLVKLDFPRRKVQSTETKKQNILLQKQYGIRGYPTIIVLNAEGKQVGQLGYQPGGPKPFIERLQKLKGK